MAQAECLGERSPSLLHAVDSLQESFSLSPPMVACLVRHINRTMTEVITPPSIERCVVELQSYFQPHIDAGRVADCCLPGSKLRLQFGKAMDINADASSSLLNVYILAIDQDYSRPRLLAHVAKKWRAVLEKTNQEGSCFVMLYHQDLVDAACVSAHQASGMMGTSDRAKKPSQHKLDAAAAALEPYFEELKALKFAPHQMCAYLPNEAPIRVVERLRAAYIERTSRLLAALDNYQKCRQRSTRINDSGTNNNSNNSTSGVEMWSLQKCWRKGYDLALHFLQFGVVGEAMTIFSRMFALYYYHSEDYGFVKNKETLARLAELSNVFNPNEFPSGKDGYPCALQDNAEIVEGLLFISACEVRCALLLGRRDTVFTRYRLFLQVSREKFTEKSSKITGAWELFFLLQCALSAMRLKWTLGEAAGCAAVGLSSPRSRVAEAQSEEHQRLVSITESDIMSQSASVANEMSASAFLPMVSPYLASLTSLDNVEKGTEKTEKIGDKGQRKVMMERLTVLCHELRVDAYSESRWTGRLLAKLASDALEFLADLAALLGYRETGEVVAPQPSSTSSANLTPTAEAFKMAEITSATAYASFYRILTETSAIGFSMANDHCLEHALCYKLALSYLIEDPAVTADLCRRRLIPFFFHYGWLQLQTVARHLFVESMDLVMQRREKYGQPLLNAEEAVALKESLVYIIGALNARGALGEEISIICRRQSPESCWRRLKGVDRNWKCFDAVKSVQGCSLSFFLKEPQVFCLHCDRLLEEAREGRRTTPSAISAKTCAKIGETILLCFTATCPIDMLKRDKEEECDESFFTLTATLVSKKEWEGAEEKTHAVNVTRVVSSSYDEVKQRVHWMWEFQPCRAGEYRLRCITLRVLATTLVYIHPETSIILSDMGSAFSPSVDNASSSAESTSRCLFSVPEPDIGIKLCVQPPDEAHCFGDSLSFFSAQVVVERPLYLPHGAITTTTMEEAVAMDDTECGKCFFESAFVQGLFGTAMVPVGAVLEPRDGRYTNTFGTTLSLDPKALAIIYISRFKRHVPPRASVLLSAIGSAPSKIVSESLTSQDVTARRPTDFSLFTETPLGGALVNQSGTLVPIMDEKTGTLTMVPFNESFVMSHLPPLVCANSGKRAVNECDNVDVGEGVRSMHLEGCILTAPKQQCCFRICLGNDEQWLGSEDSDGLLGSTSLECSLPVLPFFMSSGEECAQVSLCCWRNMESCSTNVYVPFCFAPAFAVQYTFKCFQNRVYCLVQVENVLARTSLWLRGALLEFMDTERPYILSRVPSTHERLMLREWKPQETVHMLFELTPSAVLCTREKEMHHRVRLQLLYSNWSITAHMGPLEPHILLPLSSPSICSLHSSSPAAALARTTTLGAASFSMGSSASDTEDAEQRNKPPSSSSSGATGGLLLFSAKQTQITYDSAQVEKLRATCNTFYGPVGTFTSKHSCLFIVIIFVDPLHPTYHGTCVLEATSRMEELPQSARQMMTYSSRDSNTNSVPFVDLSPVDLPGGSVFPVGEPIRFSVTLEPLAHNWPEGSACEEEFFITFKADPAAWLVTGKQRLRRTLSMMEDETLHFTAVPVPVVAAVASESFVEGNACHLFHSQEQQVTKLQKAHWNMEKEKLSVVTTPTIEIHWASPRGGANGGDTLASDDAVAIEVVQFYKSIRIQH